MAVMVLVLSVLVKELVVVVLIQDNGDRTVVVKKLKG